MEDEIKGYGSKIEERCYSAPWLPLKLLSYEEINAAVRIPARL
jgi:hypothetical protein